MKRKLVFFLIIFGFSLAFFYLPNKSLAYYDSGVIKGKENTGGSEKIRNFETSVFGSNQFNQESHAYNNVENLAISLSNMILGCASQTCQEKLGVDSGGAIGDISNLIASLYTSPPASSAYYLADLGQRLNITQPVYAQGVGFSGLQPLLPLWRAARNIAYTFFILIFIITGFAIIFRAKISPQAVVTIQSAIPKAIMALILVTFSYAIAGLMIDLMYLTIGLIGGVFASSGLITENNLLRQYTNMGFGGIMGKMLKEGWDSFWPLVFGLWEQMGAGKLGSKILGGVTGVIPGLILGLVLLFLTFKIFFSLLMAYIQIIIAILVGPFQLMISAIPGQNTFGAWVNNLIKNLLVFPGVILTFVLGEVLVKASEGEGLWMPPLLGGEINSGTITAALSLGILLMVAKIPDIIKSVFEKKPFEYGMAITEPIKAIGGATFKAGKAGWEKTPGVKEREIEKETRTKEEVESRLRQRHPDWYQKS